MNKKSYQNRIVEQLTKEPADADMVPIIAWIDE